MVVAFNNGIKNGRLLCFTSLNMTNFNAICEAFKRSRVHNAFNFIKYAKSQKLASEAVEALPKKTKHSSSRSILYLLVSIS